MKHCLYLISTFSAGFFCWAVFAVSTAFGADAGHHGEASYGDASHADAAHGAAAHAVDGHHDAGGSGLPQLDASTFPSQLFWLVVAFAVLYMIFSKKSLPDISNVLENRQNHIQSDLESAEKLKEEAEEAQHTYEKCLEDARSKSTKALQDVQDKMKEKAEKQNEAFREKADKDIQDLEKRLVKVKEDAMDDMNTIAAEVASEAAKKIVGINADIEQAKTVVKALNGTNAKAA